MYSKKRKYIGMLYIMPWLFGFLFLQLYPFILSFYYSFTNHTLFKKPKFIWFRNYIELFTIDPDFLNSIKVTLLYTIMVVLGKLLFSLFIAMILNMKIKGVNLFRTLYYLPSILGGSVAIAVLWRLMFMHQGVVNRLISHIGIQPIDWLGNPKISLFTISLLEVWQFGSSMVLFLAALKQVPRELYESAKVDGAHYFQMFFKITLPMISPIIFFNLVMQTINALQNFTSAFIITSGGPVRATYVLALKLYDDAFLHYKIGYASASSWVLFVLILIFTLMAFKSSSLWVYYSDEGAFER